MTLVWRLMKNQNIHLATTVPQYSTWKYCILVSSSMILIWLLEANYSLNILVFLYWQQIILGTFNFSILEAVLQTHMFTKYSKYLLLIIAMCRKIPSHVHMGGWCRGGHFSVRKCQRRPHFPTKSASAASIW